ncbi:MAG: hypothetical protein K2I91_00405, partial [Muribaculaceae bacterium]|nr:hypothetical protein [Muribaculaceae bacterium]
MKLFNPDKLPIVESFIRCYDEPLQRLFPDDKIKIIFRSLPDEDNDYRDIVVRLNKTVYLSTPEINKLGLTPPEIFAAIAHELGHILYHTHPWAYDAEERADSLAAELGLGRQMITVIEKIIASRRFRHITSALVRRIQYLT